MTEHPDNPPHGAVAEAQVPTVPPAQPGPPTWLPFPRAAPLPKMRLLGVGFPLVVLWVVLALTVPQFLTTVNIQNLALESSVIGILALGSTVVILVEEIDLSIGAVEGFGSVIAAIIIINHDIAWPLGVVLTILAGAGVGLVNGLVTTSIRLPSFIVTLGMMGVVNGLALEVTQGQSIYGFPSAFQFLGSGVVAGAAVPVWVALALLIVLYFVLKFTRLGWHIYATGGNRVAADLVGISTRRVKVFALALSGGCAGLAGVLTAGRLNSGSAVFGESDLLTAIAAVIIGGTALAGGSGSVLGTAGGVVLIATVQNGLNLLNVSPFWQTFVIGVIIVGAATLAELNRRMALRREVQRI
jgi:ribose transport system permease protein